MILLDLIGAANTKFHSFYPNTHRLHESLYKIERFLNQNHLLEGNNSFQFLKSYANGIVDDDHRPFLEKSMYKFYIFLINILKIYIKLLEFFIVINLEKDFFV
uniref:glutaminyl-peptide cyclotransferase n=1 Tax=Megaselia scalaris TaxID=36166 RepID=T1GBM7_MEGSC